MKLADSSTYDSERGLTRRLSAIRNAVRRRGLAYACVASLALLCGGMMLLDGWNRFFALREHAAFWLLLLVAAAALALLLRNWFFAVFRPPTSVELALEVEHGRPEFMDSLVCAAELSRRSPDSLRPLEKALLEKVEGEIRENGSLEGVFRDRLRLRHLLVPAVLIACVAAVLLHSRPVTKARFYALDLLHGTHSGLTVHGPDKPVPIHSDVQIRAEVNRWEDQARIVYQDAGGRERFVMNRRAARHYFFTFYDVRGPIRYRVETPSLASAWYTVRTYRPPQFRQIDMRLTSPAYTGRKPEVFSEFHNGSVVTGGKFHLAVRSAKGVKAALLAGGRRFPMPAAKDGALTYDSTLTKDFSFRVELTTPEGWKALGPKTTVTVDDDLPPVVDVVRPRGDLQVKVNENVDLEVRASDDFGVRNVVLEFSVSGAPREAIRLFAAGDKRVPEHTVNYKWDLGKQGVKVNDVVAFTVVVTDNREPKPQQARSDVHFIVVRPEIKPKKTKGSGKQQELDISRLIAESKRLIRFTWDLLGTPADQQSDMKDELSRDLRQLRLAARQTLNRAAAAAGGPIQGDIPMLFQALDDELGQAIALVDRSLVEESLPPQERGLAKLVAIENELLKNAAQGRGKSSGQEQNKGQKSPQGQQEQQSLAQQRREKIQAIKKAINAARELGQRQDRVDRDMRQEGQTADAKTAAALADKQEAIREDTHTLAQGLQPLLEAARATRNLDAAEIEMGRGMERLRKNDVGGGSRHGARAHNFLLASIQSLQDALRQVSANQIQQLAQSAQALSEAQRSESDSSRRLGKISNPSNSEVDAARKRQDNLKQQAEALQSAIDRTAGDLETDFPDASKALVEAGDAARKAGVVRSMKRAANALLYQAFDHARQEQVDAANGLQQLAHNLGKASRLLPSMSQNELLSAIQRMRRRAREAGQLADKSGQQDMSQLERLRQAGAADLGRLSAQTRDPTLRQLAQDMSLPMGGENVAAGARRLVGMFNAAITVLEQQLMTTELRQRIGLSREAAVPPEEYRRLVEQYFKDLSRER